MTLSPGTWRRPSRSTNSGCKPTRATRSEEHTSELQSQSNIVCRLLLEKKKRRNELVNGTRHANSSPDWEIFDTSLMGLTAALPAAASARVYTFTIPCFDITGESTTTHV